MPNILSAAINTIKTKIIVLKSRVRIQWYTAVDFQGWSKMTLKIKMTYISILESEFQKIR